MLFESNQLHLLLMSRLKIILFLVILPLMSFKAVHKYYVSLTEIEYIKKERSVQIITRIFIDDFEAVLRNRYDENITLAAKNESNEIDYYIEKYLKDKIKININNRQMDMNFLGKQYEDDMVLCYLEIQNVDKISSIKVENKFLYELFPDQKNMVRFKIYDINKSILLIKGNDKGLLNLQ